MFYVVASIVCVTLVCTHCAHGRRTALAVGWALALVLPSWMERDLGSMTVDLRSLIALGMIGYVALTVPWSEITGRWLLLDTLALLLFLAHLISTSMGYHFGASVGWASVARWAVPYVMGRITFPRLRDFREFLWLAATVCLILGVLGALESITKINLLQGLAGRGWYGSESLYRWGLRRAVGPLTHAIYFGLVGLLLLPWAVEAFWMAYRRERGARAWWKAALPAVVLIPLFSLSRGPQLTLLAALYGAAFFWWPRWRGQLAVGAVVGLLAVVTARELVWDALHVWSAESLDARPMIVRVDGEYAEYSGTSHRWLQFLVYEEAIADAGFFGFGRLGTPLEPYLPHHLQSLFRSIDNHYLYTLLTCGYVGLGLFLAAAVCGLVYLFQMAVALPAHEARLPAIMLSTLLASLVSLMTVWMDEDFAFLWLFNLGMTASWYAHWSLQAFPRSYAHRAAVEQRPPRRARRLVPGHL